MFSNSPASSAARGAWARSGQGSLPRTRCGRPRPRDRSCPLRSGPSGTLEGLRRDATAWTLPFAAARRARPGTGRWSLVQGRPAGAHLWYCACRNWNSSLMRSSDSGMVNLKGWPAAWCGVWRGGGTRERDARSDTARPPRGEEEVALPIAVGPEGKDGQSARPGPPPPRGAAHLLPTFPSLICGGPRLTAPAPTHPLQLPPSTRKRGVPAPPHRPPARSHSQPHSRSCARRMLPGPAPTPRRPSQGK